MTYLTLFAGSPAYGEYGDVILNKYSGKSGMRPVIFPHWLHRIHYTCTVCHTEIGFKLHTGDDNIRMSDIKHGKFCGVCHNSKITWGTENCDLCHSGLPGLETGIQGGNTTGGPGKF